MQLSDYAQALGAAQQLVPNWRQGDMQEAQLASARMQPQLMQAQIAQSQARTQQESQKAAYDQQRRGQFDTALTGLGARPSPEKLYQLGAQFPEFSEKLSEAAKGIAFEKRSAMVRQWAPVQALIQNNNIKGALLEIDRHTKAGAAAGEPEDEHTAELRQMLESGDPAQAKAASGILYGLIAAVNPETAAKNIAEAGMIGARKGQVVGRTIGHYDDTGAWVSDYRDPDPEANALEVGVYDNEGKRVGTQLLANGGRGGAAGVGAGGDARGGGGDVSRLINTDAGGGYVPEGVKTLGQFVGFGKDLNRRGAKSSSAGTYQINGSTMAEFAPKALGPGWKNAPFNADTQEQVGAEIFNWAKQQPDPAKALRGRWVSLDARTAAQLVQGSWQQARGVIAQGETGGARGASAGPAVAANGYIGPVASAGGGGGLGDPTLTGDAYLATVPAFERAKIKAIAEGRVAAPRPGTKFGEAVLTKVAQYDPTFDAANSQSRMTTRKDFTSGKSAQAVNALNTAMGHLLHLDTQAKGLGNFSTLPGVLNPIYNAGRKAGGDTKLPAFEQTKQAASSEMRKVFAGAGGGNLTELKEWQESLDSSLSYEQLHAAIANGVELMGSRLNALQDQYQTGMGRSDQPMELIKPGIASATRKRFGINLGGASAAPSSRSGAASPAPSGFRILKVRPK